MRRDTVDFLKVIRSMCTKHRFRDGSARLHNYMLYSIPKTGDITQIIRDPLRQLNAYLIESVSSPSCEPAAGLDRGLVK
jgi:hypothetical protein